MTKIDEKVEELTELIKELDLIEADTLEYSLADAMREGSLVTAQAQGWGNGDTACALSAAHIAARAKGLV